MRIDVISLFPDYFGAGMAPGVIDRARQRGLLDIHAWNPRDFTEDNYRTVDDRPFGGGPGMLMLIDPLRKALAAARAAAPEPVSTIYLSPQGRPLNQQLVRELAARPRLLMLCGRYEGVDERLLAAEVDEEISLGDYVLSGGELAAAVLIDAVGRLQDGALNDADSADQDSFENGLLDCPHYTRPVQHELGDVPDVLRSGDHAAIRRWRRQQSLLRTRDRRPDLLQSADISDAERAWLAQQPASAKGQDDS